MSNLILLNGGKADSKTPLRQAIYLWFINLFHVHRYQDEKITNRTTIEGIVSGIIHVQICICGLRRSQIVSGRGIE